MQCGYSFFKLSKNVFVEISSLNLADSNLEKYYSQDTVRNFNLCSLCSTVDKSIVNHQLPRYLPPKGTGGGFHQLVIDRCRDRLPPEGGTITVCKHQTRRLRTSFAAITYLHTFLGVNHRVLLLPPTNAYLQPHCATENVTRSGSAVGIHKGPDLVKIRAKFHI